ncbi:hypothetical protein AAC387_Pa07g3916 [Persea americana]
MFQLSTTLRGGKVTVGALPPLSSAAEQHFLVFLRSERRKTCSCSFTAALIGGKVAFPVFLRSDRRKTGNCSFTAALIGGIVDFCNFPALRGGKLEIADTLGAHMAVIFQSYFLSFFPFFCLLEGQWSRLSSTKCRVDKFE